MHRNVFVLLLLLALAVPASAMEPRESAHDPQPLVAAEVEILGWTQGSPHEWDHSRDVRLAYRITNTGSLNLQAYEITFEVYCCNGSLYQGDAVGGPLAIGQTREAQTFLVTQGDQALYVTVHQVRLTPGDPHPISSFQEVEI